MARPTRVQRIAIAERRAKAVNMKLAGAKYAEIATELGYKSPGAACQDITRALEQAVAEQSRSIELLREEELQRLDLLLAEAWAVLKRQHVTVSHGKIVCGEDGRPLEDDGPVLQAIDRILKIQERRAKYIPGLEAAQRHEVVTMDAIEAEIARLTAELGADETREAAAPETAPAGES